MKRLLASLSILFVFSPCSKAQTTGDVDRAIHKFEATIDSAFAIDRWDGESLKSKLAPALIAYLMKALPHVNGSLRYEYSCAQGSVRYATATDRKFRLWTFDVGGGESGSYLSLAEYEGDRGSHILNVSPKGKREYVVSSGGWCDTIYSIKSDAGVSYYLPLLHFAADNRNAGMGIDAYGIEGGRLLTRVKLFRTPKKDLSSISFWYDFFDSGDEKTGEVPTIRLGPDGKSLLIPLVKGTKVTKSNLRYDFDGKQFVYKAIDK